jgi:hypothetical protein
MPLVLELAAPEATPAFMPPVFELADPDATPTFRPPVLPAAPPAMPALARLPGALPVAAAVGAVEEVDEVPPKRPDNPPTAPRPVEAFWHPSSAIWESCWDVSWPAGTSHISARAPVTPSPMPKATTLTEAKIRMIILLSVETFEMRMRQHWKRHLQVGCNLKLCLTSG